MRAQQALSRRNSRIMAGVLACAAILTLSTSAVIWAQQPSTQPAAVKSEIQNPKSEIRFDGGVIIPIRDEITDVTRDSIRRRLKTAREQNAKLIVFELDTPGGMVTSTLEICDDIKKLRDEGITTCAWVHPRAYSGGTIIALAADKIVMSPNATMGDCQPIIFTDSGAKSLPKDIEAKAKSPLLAELRDSVRRNGYNMNMVLALIEPELEIFWVENSVTGERRFVTVGERDELFGLKSAPTGSMPAETKDDADESFRPAQASPPVPDSLSKTDWHYVANAPGIGKPRQPIDGARELLTMKTLEAQAYGFAQGVVNGDAELGRFFSVTDSLRRLDSNWFESIVEWLASPTIRGILYLFVVLGVYAEFHTPGFGLAGGVAVLALVLFLAAPYMTGFTVTWEIVAVIFGLILLAVEVFVIPGFGIAGIAGLLLLAVGLVSSFVPKEIPTPGGGWLPTMPVTMTYLKHGLWALAGGSTGALVGGIVLARFLPKLPVAGRLVLANPTREQIIPDDPYEGQAQVGHIGKTEGPLRPAGKVRFGALLVDVISDGEFIQPGTRVEVIERAGARVVVRRVD
jgi:membrane-bound serine protease (ClpP class)